MSQALAQPSTAPPARPARSVRIGSTSYPVVLPRLADSRLHVAAIVITLNPGVYTMDVTSADTSSGVGMVEIYVLP